MSALLQPAYPFVTVRIDTSGLVPTAQRSPGVVAVVGNAATGASVGANVPAEVTDHASVMAAFAAGTTANALTRSLDLVLQQDPRPSKIYGVRTASDGDYAAALAALDAVDDVTFVCLAGESAVGKASTGTVAATGLMALKEHVENASAAGNERLGVAMVDPTAVRTPTYVADVLAPGAYGAVRSDSSRMILIAARGATVDPTSSTAGADAAAAAMATIAGYPPGTSVVLKQVRGFSMPLAGQYTPAETTQLAEQGVIPLIDPALIPGSGLYLGDGGLFTSDPAISYVDIATLLAQVKFALRAGLIGSVGDSRITKPGLTSLRLRVEAILSGFVRAGSVDSFSVTIPLLAVLSVPDAARDPADVAALATARQTRQLSVELTMTIAAVIHQLNLVLAPQY